MPFALKGSVAGCCTCISVCGDLWLVIANLPRLVGHCDASKGGEMVMCLWLKFRPRSFNETTNESKNAVEIR